MIRVLIVDDSAVVRAFLRDALESDPDVRVVGEAENGKQGVELTGSLKPSLVTMDVRMPVMDGLEATAEIMARCATPILVVTASLDREETNLSFRAIQLGALDVMLKPKAHTPDNFRGMAADLVGRVKMLSRIHVIQRPHGARRKTRRLAPHRLSERRRVVAIGASLGGPSAVLHVLQGLPPNFPAPVLLVQHIAPGFADGYAAWLSREVPLPVAVARDGDLVRPGHVLVAPSHSHMAVAGGTIRLVDAPPINSCKPAIDVLFEAVAREYGEDAVSVLLTGMGNDGAEGSRHVKTARGYTIAQDKETCVVFGMPKVAIEMGVVDAVLPLAEISKELIKLVAPAAR